MSTSNAQDANESTFNAAYVSKTAPGQTMAGDLTITDSTASTDKDTGSIVTEGGVGVEGDINAGGDIGATGDVTGTNVTASGNVTGSNLSGTNTGDVSLTAVGSSPNANAASITGQQVNLQPASSSFPGVVSTASQNFAGQKTFDGKVGVKTSSIEATAEFQVDSTERGVLVPRMTEAQRDAISSPAGGLCIYNEDDERLESYDDDTEVWVQYGSGEGGSGSGAKNFFSNPNFEANTDGVSTYDDGTSYVDGTGGSPSAVTITTTTTSTEILEGARSLEINKAASDASGEGVTFLTDSVDRIDQGKPLFISFAYDFTANYTDDDVKVHAYDVTNTTEILVEGLGPEKLATLKNRKGTFSGRIQTADDVATIRLSLHIESDSTTGSAWDCFIDEVKIGPQEKVLGLAGGGWQDISSNVTPTNFGTVSGTQAYMRRVGDTAEIHGSFTCGTVSGADARVDFDNIVFDTSLMPVTGLSQVELGQGIKRTASDTAYGSIMSIAFYDGSDTNSIFFAGGSQASGSSGILQKITASTIAESNQEFSFFIRVPVVGWNSGVATAGSSVYKMSTFLANGTRVTSSAPTELGEYRSYLRNAAANTVTETNGSPTATPTAANGIALYSATAFSSADTNNEPSRYDIFVGKNKHVSWSFYENTAMAGAMDVTPQLTSSASYGYLTHYERSTGIASVWKATAGGATLYLGQDIDMNSLSSGPHYFDITVSDDTNFHQSDVPRDFVQLSVGAGHGSTNTRIRDFGSVTHSQGSGATGAVDTTNGASITINRSAVWSIEYKDDSSISSDFGITKNGTEPTTSFGSITDANEALAHTEVGGSNSGLCTYTGPLEAGDVIRAHTDASPNSTATGTTRSFLRVTRISD